MKSIMKYTNLERLGVSLFKGFSELIRLSSDSLLSFHRDCKYEGTHSLRDVGERCIWLKLNEVISESPVTY